MRLARQGQFDAADQVVERSLASRQPDYEAFWNYLFYLVNNGGEPSRAARLGQKWLPSIRRTAPPAEGRILKETALGVLFGEFRRTHELADRSLAKQLLEEAVEVNPKVSEAYVHLALLATLEGQKQVSMSMLNRAIETASDEAARQAFIGFRQSATKDPTYMIAAARRMYQME